jgi:hypothetical protein
VFPLKFIFVLGRIVFCYFIQRDLLLYLKLHDYRENTNLQPYLLLDLSTHAKLFIPLYNRDFFVD